MKASTTRKVNTTATPAQAARRRDTLVTALSQRTTPTDEQLREAALQDFITASHAQVKFWRTVALLACAICVAETFILAFARHAGTV